MLDRSVPKKVRFTSQNNLAAPAYQPRHTSVQTLADIGGQSRSAGSAGFGMVTSFCPLFMVNLISYEGLGRKGCFNVFGELGIRVRGSYRGVAKGDI